MIPQTKPRLSYINSENISSIELLKPELASAWDVYVHKHPQATFCHLSGWKNIIENVYRHKAYYLAAIEKKALARPKNLQCSKGRKTQIVGILPLIHLKHYLFGNSLISLPYLDYGGILADNKAVEKSLISEAIELAQKLKVSTLEFRHIKPSSFLNEKHISMPNMTFQTFSHKVHMVFRLPNNPEALMNSFKSKLRSQIKRPIKEGCTAVIGSLELLDDFYKVFSINMRDLGSPVHSKKFLKFVLNEFKEARICMVYKGKKALAGAIVIGFKGRLNNPWASSLHKFKLWYLPCD